MALNDWSLVGDWIVGSNMPRRRRAAAASPSASTPAICISCMGGLNGMRVRYRIRIDGQAPGADAGMDVERRGRGRGDRRAALPARPAARRRRERTFEIEFLDPGVRAFAFTFG